MNQVCFIDKTRFCRTLEVSALRVPKKYCQRVQKQLWKYTLVYPQIKHIIDDREDKECKLLVLNQRLDKALNEGKDLDLQVQKIVQTYNLKIQDIDVDIKYENLTIDQVLKEILPYNIDYPRSYEIIGHIIHLNLREEQLPYKSIIGQVFLDKNPQIKTVINKVSNIENVFRVLNMEIIAGEKKMITEVKRGQMRLKLDYSQVYWNSRLQEEHQRLVSLFSPGQVILDAMCGIGPFTIQAAIKSCKVYANDLNPSSIKYLLQNIKLNKVQNKVVPFCMDARLFLNVICGNVGKRQFEQIKMVQQEPVVIQSEFQYKQQGLLFNHIVMNLPAIAIEFLDVFKNLLNQQLWEERELPMIHLYSFMQEKDGIHRLKENMDQKLGIKLSMKNIRFYQVRDVAPQKHMYCASFRLPRDDFFFQKSRLDDCKENFIQNIDNKKRKVQLQAQK